MAGYHMVAAFPHPSLLDHFLLSCELKVSRWWGGDGGGAGMCGCGETKNSEGPVLKLMPL